MNTIRMELNMKQQDDLQRLIDMTRDYCQEHGISDQDETDALKALYKLVPRQAEIVTKKNKKKEDKKDFMDMWLETIKGGM